MSDQNVQSAMQTDLVERVLKKDPRALARVITVLENETPGSSAILAAIQSHVDQSNIIGVTGPPGAGKSTLIDALIHELRGRGKTVGVLAVDPSSPNSGGAVLGDRIRMNRHAGDSGVFVRSLASRGHLGGLFRAAWAVVQAMDAYGPDYIIIETVGAGQSEVEIAHIASTRLVLCAPGTGDDIQAIKAGILEIADILVVNKGDHPMAEETKHQLEATVRLRDPRMSKAQVIVTVATNGQGVPELVDLLEKRATMLPPKSIARQERMRHIVANAAAEAVRQKILAGTSPYLISIFNDLEIGTISTKQAAFDAVGIVVAGKGGC